jgi:hypothetical protein
MVGVQDAYGNSKPNVSTSPRINPREKEEGFTYRYITARPNDLDTKERLNRAQSQCGKDRSTFQCNEYLTWLRLIEQSKVL